MMENDVSLGTATNFFPKLVFQREVGEASSSNQRSMERVLLENVVKNLKISAEYRFRRYRQSEGAPVYGLEFCNNGNMVLTAHGDGIVNLHDVRTQKCILGTPRGGNGGHADAANGCTSIENNVFASYSDDKTVMVWDVRRMNNALKECVGHMNWVKNVSVMNNGKTLVSSGCDQSVRSYDLNRPENQLESCPLLYLDGLCRTKLHPTENTLYLSTWRTSVLAITNLDLIYLEQDCLNYYLSANREIKSSTKVPPFSKTRNRLEVVHYVPYSGSVLTSGQSLAIHPHGNCCAVRHSREVPDPEYRYYPIRMHTEWLALYDLQSTEKINKLQEEPEFTNIDYDAKPVKKWLRNKNWSTMAARDKWKIWNRMRMTEKIEIDLLRHSDITKLRLSLLYSEWIDDNYDNRIGLKPQLVQNSRFYTECEAFFPGKIKEISFSPCGRLLLDPTRQGFQVLGYDTELSNYPGHDKPENEGPKKLQKISEHEIHSANCVCAKFSPDSSSIVCGTLEGKVVWFAKSIR